MQAIVQSAYGIDPDAVLRIAEVPRPAIQPGEVLVEVAAASVDRGTWHLMTGRPRLMRLFGFGFRRPKAPNPGRAFAGTIVSAGSSVTEFRPGDEVYGTCDGSFAEYAAAEVSKIARKPTNLSFAPAAAVPVSGVTALQALREAKLQPDQRVLIIGASGGVGTFLVQIAKARGAHVTAVASGAKLDLVSALGADEIVDYTRDDIVDGIHRYDVIFDVGGNRPLSRVRRALAPNGTLVIVGGETEGRWLGGFARNLRMMMIAPFVRGQRLRSLASRENGADLEALRALIEAGRLAPVVDCTYALRETAAAVRHLTDGHARGKVVVTV